MVLIDDDAISNFLSSKLIEKEQFAGKVVSYLSAEDALTSISEVLSANVAESPDIIFLDINMPSMDGWGFLEEYKKLPKDFTSRCRLFMLSSAVDKKDIVQARSYKEVEEFISKPLSPEILNFIQDTHSSER